MRKALFDQINSALKSRQDWETKQTTWNKMRNTGIKRFSRPYPNAPDLHYKLGDALIGKIKPLYIQQLYGGETIASFVSLKQQDSQATSSANYWFDYNLKQKTNFEREIFIAADQLEERGAVPVKVRWDSDNNKLSFCTCEPLHVIVPEGTEELCDADWLVHVIHLSEAQYRANSRFNHDDEFVKSIKGKGHSQESGSSELSQNKELREGITHSDNGETIVLWEVYERDRIGKKITVDTVAPVLPPEENEVRGQFGLPYNKGVFKGGYRMPFMKFRAEIKEKGYYSERGTVEVTAAHEASLNKTWNQRHQWSDFHNNPTYTTEKAIPNPSNIKTHPGAIMGDGLMPNFPPPIPSSLKEEMDFTRALAEDKVQIPDLGASQHLAPGKGKGGNVTATQIEAVMGQTSQGSDLRSRVFRMDLAELLNMAWSLLIQYQVNDFMYVLDDEIQQVTQEALHDQYGIQPNGSPDSWNKGQQLAKAYARFQQFNGDPWIDQGELRKSVLELDDPRLVKRLYRDQGIAAKEQAEQQAVECLLMLNGWAAQVEASDDDAVHADTLGKFFERRLGTGQEVTPELARLGLQHGAEHDQAMAQKKNPARQQIQAQFAQLIQVLGQIAQSDQAQNVIAMQPQGMGGQGQQPPAAAPSLTGGAGESGPPPGKGDSAKLMHGLGALISKGVPITPDQINAVMAEAGLPPIGPVPQEVAQ